MALHGDKLQQERDDIMRQYKSQKFPILVATDVVGLYLILKLKNQEFNKKYLKTSKRIRYKIDKNSC